MSRFGEVKPQRPSGDPVREAFGTNLRRLRKAANLSQEEVAYRAGLHRTEIGLLERGERLPMVRTLLKLAGALDVEPGELLKGVAWQPGAVRHGGFEAGED